MPLWSQILLPALAVVAAIASAIAAGKACSVSRQAFKWQRKQVAPRVQVRACLDYRAPSVIFLEIQNIGQGPAFDVSFECSSEVPARAYGLDPAGIDVNSIASMDCGPLVDGIPALAAGDKRVIMWGQYPGLFAVLGDAFVRVKARFKDEEQVEHETLSLIEVKSFEGTDASQSYPDMQSARALEKIAKCIEQSSSGFAPLVVETPVQRSERQQELHRRANRSAS